MATYAHTQSLSLVTLLGAGLLTLVLGCQQHRDPLLATPQTNPALLPVGHVGVGSDEFSPAQFHLEIDTATLAYELTPTRVGAAQPPQNLSFDFDIEKFRQPATLAVTSIYRDTDGTIYVYYVHQHPFPAPNLELPPSGLNRADLGYTGRLLLMTSGPPSFYLENAVRANPGIVLSADGYLNPGNLLANGPEIPFVNTFPYQLLVDEKRDNRFHARNLGAMTGTFYPEEGGWQRTNLDDSDGNRGWFGYDYLHGGEGASGFFRLSPTALESPSFGLDLALLIKYTDPRGAADIANRLPPETVDVTSFAYRLPYAALDISRIESPNFASIGYAGGATYDLQMKVRDWDQAAAEAPTHDLGSQPDVSRIQAGASGPAAARIEFPGLFAGELPLPYASVGSGLPNDEMVYALQLTNTLEPPPGVIWGIAEFVDPEDEDPNGFMYRYGVDPDTIAADPGRALKRVTYQFVQLTVQEPPVDPAPPTIVKIEPDLTSIAGNCFGSATFEATTTGNPYQFIWAFPDGGVEEVELLQGASPTETFRLSAPGLYTGYLTVVSAYGTSAPFAFPFRVEAPYLQSTKLAVDTTVDARAISVQQIGVRAQAALIDDATGGLYHYRATKNIPVVANDWARVQLDPDTAESNPQLAILEDKPVVIYKRNNGKTRIALATTATPATVTDWTFYSFPDAVTLHSEVLVTGNRLMFAYANSVTAQLEIARANIAIPGASDWLYYVPGNSGVEMLRPRLFQAANALFLFHHRVDNRLLYNISFDTSPREQFDWTTQLVADPRGGREVLDFYVRDNNPHVTIYEPGQADVLLYVGKANYPYFPSDWEIRELQVYTTQFPFSASHPIGERLVMGSGAMNAFVQPSVMLATRDEGYTLNDLMYHAVSTEQGDFGTIPVRTLTTTGEPRLMMLVANGPGGFRQAVLDQPWH